MIVIEAVLEAFPDKRDAFIALSRRITADSRREAGCVLYRFSCDTENAQRFYLTEIWKSEDDLKAHFKTDAFKNFFTEFPDIGRFLDTVSWQGDLSSYTVPGTEE